MGKIIGAILSLLPLSVFGSVKDIDLSVIEIQIQQDVELVTRYRNGFKITLDYMGSLPDIFPAEK